ncbi:hypothetical protein BD289DRAFT_77058 [Coniella lustricola]|uniref:Uncharacterized protein n=1 Tax=Coniella lustricola TaxID=2025994 RepID=A0A2T2ZZB8_9PEZI|nr:hypothetical protein BD289DRAFT_77058 [Coniella lustricola]
MIHNSVCQTRRSSWCNVAAHISYLQSPSTSRYLAATMPCKESSVPCRPVGERICLAQHVDTQSLPEPPPPLPPRPPSSSRSTHSIPRPTGSSLSLQADQLFPASFGLGKQDRTTGPQPFIFVLGRLACLLVGQVDLPCQAGSTWCYTAHDTDYLCPFLSTVPGV